MKLILYLIFCFKDIYLLFVIIKLFTMEFVVFPFLHSLDKVKCMYRNAQVGKRAVATDYHDKSYLILMKDRCHLQQYWKDAILRKYTTFALLTISNLVEVRISPGSNR